MIRTSRGDVTGRSMLAPEMEIRMEIRDSSIFMARPRLRLVSPVLALRK